MIQQLILLRQLKRRNKQGFSGASELVTAVADGTKAVFLLSTAEFERIGFQIVNNGYCDSTPNRNRLLANHMF